MTTPDNEPSQPPEKDTALNNIYELMREGLGHLIERDRDERHWKILKRTVMGGLTVGAILMWFALYAPMFGWTREPTEAAIGVVPIQGAIGGAGGMSGQTLVPAIERACKSGNTKAVVLRITSPGGSPTDAERIAGALQACRPSGPDAKSKPVIAVIEGIGASAAYLIAVHADEVIASRYAMVGSIGAVMRTFEAEGAMSKLGVRERVFASGQLKSGNSPWTSNTQAQDALSQSLVDGIAKLFIADVRERRGARLKETPDMFSGRVWLGDEALALGLVDSISTFEQLKEARFKDLPVHDFRPQQTLQDKLGMKAMVREFGAGVASEISGSQWD